MDYDAILQKAKENNNQHSKLKNKIIHLLCCGFSIKEIEIECDIDDCNKFLPDSILSLYVEFIINGLLNEDGISDIKKQLNVFYNIQISSQGIYYFLASINLSSPSKIFTSNDKVWKIFFNHYKNEIDFNNVLPNKVFKNKSIGLKLESIKLKFIKFPKYQKEMRDFWDFFSNDFFPNPIIKDKKQEVIDYLANNKDLNFDNVSSWGNGGLVRRIVTLRTKYFNSSFDEQKKLKEYWDCIPESFWNRQRVKQRTDTEWKLLFIQYGIEQGFDSLNLKTVYKGEKLGSKLNSIKTNYNKSTPKEQEKIRLFWKCFPESIWENKNSQYRTDEDWKNAYNSYFAKHSIDELNVKTNHKNLNIGSKFISILSIYAKSFPHYRKEIKFFWDCFPSQVWEQDFINKFIQGNTFENLFKTTMEFVKLNGISSVLKNTKYKDLSIGNFRENCIKEYASFEDGMEKLNFINQFELIDRDFLRLDEFILNKTEYKKMTEFFCKEFGYDNLYDDTEYKAFKIGYFRDKQRKIFSSLKTQEEKDSMIKEFEYISPKYLIFEDKKITKDTLLKNATINFCLQYGYDSLNVSSVHQSFNIGYFRDKQRKIFSSLKTQEEKDSMIKEFEYISPKYLINENIKPAINNVADSCSYLKKSVVNNQAPKGSLKKKQRKEILQDLKTQKTQKIKKEKSENRPSPKREKLEKKPLLEREKEAELREKFINATLFFIGLWGYKDLDKKSLSYGLKIGEYREKQRKIYDSLKTEKEKLEMLELFKSLPIEYLKG